VLDAALALDDCDFLAVLSEMLLVRHERQEHLARRHHAAATASSDIPFDDPFYDDPFDEVPAAIPLASRRGRARKR